MMNTQNAFDYLIRVKGVLYFCLSCGLVGGIGGIGIGMYENDFGVLISSLFVLIVAIIAFAYIKRIFKRGHF